MEDADAVERLVNDATIADIGMAGLREAELRKQWSEKRGWEKHVVVEDAIGGVAAVLWVEDEGDQGAPSLYFEVHIAAPHRQEGLEAQLLDLAEARARRLAKLLGKPVTLATNVNIDGARSVLDARGYERGLRHHAMFVELDQVEWEPLWPADVRLRGYAEDEDDLVMYETMHAGFGQDWPAGTDASGWIRDHRGAPGYDPDLWFFAESEGKAVGAVQCREQWHGQHDTGWIKNLAVLPGWRRRGVGRALLHEAFRRFRLRGRARVVLGVDAANPANAKRFYENAGMYERGSSTDHHKTIDPADEAAIFDGAATSSRHRVDAPVEPTRP